MKPNEFVSVVLLILTITAIVIVVNYFGLEEFGERWLR